MSFPCLPIGSSHALSGNPKSISMWQAYLKIALIALPDLFSFPGQVFLVSSLFNMFSSPHKNLMNSWWLAVKKLSWVCVWDLELEDKSWSDHQSRDFFWMDQLHLGPHWWSSHFAISLVHRDCLYVLWSQELHRCLSSLLLHNWKMTGKLPRRCCETHHSSTRTLPGNTDNRRHLNRVTHWYARKITKLSAIPVDMATYCTMRYRNKTLA